MSWYVMKSTTACMSYIPVDESGSGFNVFTTPLDKMPAHVIAHLHPHHRKLADCINVSLELLLSHRVMNIVRGLRVDPAVWFIRASVMHDTQLLANDYSYGFANRFWPVIDRVRSTITYYDSAPHIIFNVIDRVVDATAIPPYDLFFAEDQCRTMVTERLRSAFEFAQISGCAFTKVVLSPGE
ncbi:MAG: hypothetical protein K1X74_11010 [Pirellulales bacterium]|nr:hypothetical protein [Pirellulales bacterium]